jgi:hypothetical protein
MISQWIVLALFLVTVVLVAWMLHGERRAHSKTLDRLMVLAERPAAVQADDDELGWMDPETGEIVPLVRNQQNSGVEDVEGSMPGQS